MACINALTLLQVVMSFFLKKDPRIKILYKQRIKRIDYRKVIKYTLIASFVILFSPIYNGTFIWYYIFFPITIVAFLLIHGVCHISLEGKGGEYSHITNEEIVAHNREESIKEILK